MSESALTQSPAYPHPIRAWWTVAVFGLALIVSFTDRLILGALVDPIKASLRVSDSAIGLVQGAAFVLVYVLAGLLLGRLADRRHRLTILFLGAMVWCAGTIACGLSASYEQLVVARAIVGIGEAALGPAAVSIIVNSFPPQRRGTATSIFFLGAFIGAPASIVVGGVMLSWAEAGMFAGIPTIGGLEPWRAVLVLVGASGLIAPVLFLTLKEPARQGEPRALPLSVMVKRLAAEGRSLIPLYVAIGLMNVGDYGMFAWLPSVLSRRFAMPPAEVGQWFGAVTVAAGTLGCVIAGVTSDAIARRFGQRGRLFFPLATAVLAASGAALISFADVSFVLVGLAMWVLFSSITNIGGVAALQALVPSEYSGVGIALMAFCNVLLGLGLGPVLVPLVTEHVYGDAASVALSITSVVAPTALLAMMLFWYAGRGAAVRLPSA